MVIEKLLGLTHQGVDFGTVHRQRSRGCCESSIWRGRRQRPGAALLFALLLLAGPAARADETAALADLEVTVSVLNEAVRTVLTTLATQTGLAIRLTDRVPDSPVTLDLRQQPLNKVLDLLCRGAGLRWAVGRGGVVIDILPGEWVELPELGRLPTTGLRLQHGLLLREVTFGFEEVPLREVVVRLASATKVPIDVAPVVPSSLRLTGVFTATPLSRALAMLCRASGLYVSAQPGNRLRFETPDRVVAQRAGAPAGEVVEHYPSPWFGPLGELVEPALWANPAAWGVRIVTLPDGQVRLAAAEPEPPATPPAG